jgi:hypothetical protein
LRSIATINVGTKDVRCEVQYNSAHVPSTSFVNRTTRPHGGVITCFKSSTAEHFQKAANFVLFDHAGEQATIEALIETNKALPLWPIMPLPTKEGALERRRQRQSRGHANVIQRT